MGVVGLSPGARPCHDTAGVFERVSHEGRGRGEGEGMCRAAGQVLAVRSIRRTDVFSSVCESVLKFGRQWISSGFLFMKPTGLALAIIYPYARTVLY